MSLDARIDLIRKLEELRGSTVICYLTSLRQNVPAIIADDQVRVIFDHVERFPKRPIEKLDVFLVSNGGAGTVPWRLTALFREMAKRVSVLLPYRAYSAATMIALGADEIVMHPFAEMGPIDPTVQNEFNPKENGRTLGISVEDVTAYVQFVRETVGITHEDELIQALHSLTEKVHPLALGNVERFLSQSRMIAKKILRTHNKAYDDHKIDEIVENMASRLYFHGHPINRVEARKDLSLKVAASVPSEVERSMWELYKLYEVEFKNLNQFHPPGMLANAQRSGQVAPGVQPMVETELLHSCVESRRLSSWNYSKQLFTLLPGPNPGSSQIRQDLLDAGWRHQEIDQQAIPPDQT